MISRQVDYFTASIFAKKSRKAEKLYTSGDMVFIKPKEYIFKVKSLEVNTVVNSMGFLLYRYCVMEILYFNHLCLYSIDSKTCERQVGPFYF